MVVTTKRIKKDFSGMEVGDSKKFYDDDLHAVMKSTKYFCKKNNLDWKFSCSTEFDCIKATRIS